MNPTIGRIVLVKYCGKICPAVIVKVWSEISINVVAFLDGTEGVPYANPSPTIHLTSVSLHDGIYDKDSPSECHWMWPVKTFQENVQEGIL